jgi:transcriptional regulator with XRE-family HTH domain
MTQEQLRSILSDNIKIRRKQLNISQSKLAEMIDMSTNYITDIENQRTWVSDTTLIKIASVLGVEVYELLKPHTNNIITNDSQVKENAGLILREKREELKKMLDYKIDEAISLILESEPAFIDVKTEN